ncbi:MULTISPECIES: DUF6082 family protein [unclassified Streptomyces]|uniref:DUF6082 family protein n=1 Tax=unclassified Streptomyces TaxID=2593676 RepID=UPI0033A1A9F6
MKPSSAVIVLAVVGIASNALAERRHRERLDAHGVDLHQRLCESITGDERKLALWDLNGLSPEEFARNVAVNQQLAFTQWKFRARLLNETALIVQIRHLLGRPGVREYWALHQVFRTDEATNRRDQKFLRLFDEEYERAVRQDRKQPAPASPAAAS